MNIWFTSDTHFGHTKMLDYLKRPFPTCEDMDDGMIQNWNKLVQANDVVYHLGDFAWRNHDKYLKRIHGHVVLIEGNHDKRPQLFHPRYKMYDLDIDDVHIVLCHFCLRVWNRSHFNSWHLYGHSHAGLPPIGKSWDVGVDNNNYKPIPFEDIKTIMANRPDNVNFIPEEKRGRTRNDSKSENDVQAGEDD